METFVLHVKPPTNSGTKSEGFTWEMLLGYQATKKTWERQANKETAFLGRTHAAFPFGNPARISCFGALGEKARGGRYIRVKDGWHYWGNGYTCCLQWNQSLLLVVLYKM